MAPNDSDDDAAAQLARRAALIMLDVISSLGDPTTLPDLGTDIPASAYAVLATLWPAGLTVTVSARTPRDAVVWREPFAASVAGFAALATSLRAARGECVVCCVLDRGGATPADAIALASACALWAGADAASTTWKVIPLPAGYIVVDSDGRGTGPAYAMIQRLDAGRRGIR